MSMSFGFKTYRRKPQNSCGFVIEPKFCSISLSIFSIFAEDLKDSQHVKYDVKQEKSFVIVKKCLPFYP